MARTATDFFGVAIGLRATGLRAGAFFAARFEEATAFFATGLRAFAPAFDFASFFGTARVAFAFVVFPAAGFRFAVERPEEARLLARDPERLRLLVTALMEVQYEGKWSLNRSEDAVGE